MVRSTPVRRLLTCLFAFAALLAGGAAAKRLSWGLRHDHPIKKVTNSVSDAVTGAKPQKAGRAPQEDTPRHKQAYATFVYGDAFVLGVRVLGQSIRATGTERDLVVVAAGNIKKSSIDTLRADGWRVKTTDIIYNPALGPQSTGFPPAFWAVYTKLNVFSLEEYEAVVYLDADTIVVNPMDEVFNCPGFCATLRHSEKFNSGVMKIANPSKALFDDMTSKIHELRSYTGGDQGFLNQYFEGFMDAPVFDPAGDYAKSTLKYMRLPTVYNADIGLFVVNSNRWMLPVTDIRVMHFTLGPFKPWDWWSGWLVKENWRWDRLRQDLPRDSRGMAHGYSKRQVFAQRVLPVFPVVLWLVVAYKLRHPDAYFFTNFLSSKQQQTVSRMSCIAIEAVLPSAIAGGKIAPPFFVAISILCGYACLAIGLLVAVSLVPHEIEPFWGWLLVYEYGFTIALLLAAKYLHVAFVWGCKVAKTAALNSATLGAHTQPPWRQSITCTIMAIALLGCGPWVADLLHITSFVTKIIVTILYGLAANTMLTHFFASLATSWFAHGRAETIAGNQ